MEDTITIQTYNLGKTHIIVNNIQPYQSFLIESDRLTESDEKVNLITLTANIIVKEALNQCIKPKAELIKLWIMDKFTAVNLITSIGEFSLNTMNYSTFLEVLPSTLGDKIRLKIDKVHAQHRATTIGFTLYIHRDGNSISQFVKNRQISVQFGNVKHQKTCRFEVTSFSVLAQHASKTPSLQAKKIVDRFDFIDNRASLPLGLIVSPAQVYEIISLCQPSLNGIEKYIKSSPQYVSPPSKDSKLYLCHDMKGGYIQDINFQNSLPAIQKEQILHYRSLHLQQAQIFNYFSHHNITIPPLHWRIACRRAGTKCIGTFILQHQNFSQATIFSQEFALLLVAIAKKCGFDGYLLNIQTKVSGIGMFKKWVGYLTQKLHEHIPNSCLIWYDSISQRDGVIRYQNALTQENMEFYNLTDGLFTNYWWNEQLLLKTVKNKANNPKRVYMGSDCFGRRTYEGGMYHTYKAVNKILEHKDEISVALFAPGFTYEDGGQNNRKLFHLNELALYKGIKAQVIPIDKWKTPKPNNWKKQGDWTATSNELCERTAQFNFPPLEKNSFVNVQFMAQVMGTPPVAESPYKFILQLLDDSGNVLHQTEAHNFTNYRKTTDKPQMTSYELSVSEQLVGSNPYRVRVVEMGKCSLNWAGHFGPRYKGEKVIILVYEKERNWSSKLAVQQVRIGTPFHSLCNAANADHFHYLGTQVQTKYSFLADFDLPHTHIINHPFETELDYSLAFIGGTSLCVKRETIKLLKVVIPQSLDLNHVYFMQVTVRDTPEVQLNFKYVSKNEQERIFAAKLQRTEQFGEWKRFTFRLTTKVQIVKNDVRSIIDIVSTKQPYTIGQIKIFNKNAQVQSDLKCKVEASKDYLPTKHLYLNFTLESENHQRLLLLVEQSACFAYFTHGKARLDNVKIVKGLNFTIKVIDVEGESEIILTEKVLFSSEIVKGTIIF